MAHQDKAGNIYRKESGEWQVLRAGLVWTPFSADVDFELTDGTVIPAQTNQVSAPKWSESEKSILISHARDIHMQLVASGEGIIDVSARGEDKEYIDESGVYAVKRAQALIKALKDEGVL